MYLISETTKEEREAIVKESLGNIDGKRERREINMEFNARYVKGEDMPGRERCVYGK